MQSNEEADEGVAFDPDICAELYNRIVRIGFHGSQRDQRGERLLRSWSEAWQSDPLLPQAYETFPDELISFLEQLDVVVGPDGRPSPADVLVVHLQALSSPGAMMSVGPVPGTRDIPGLEDSIVLFHNNLYSLEDSLGIVMDLQNLAICYFPHLTDYDPDFPEASPWCSLQQLLTRLNAIIDVGLYQPVHPGQERHTSGDTFITGWDLVPWNHEFSLAQSLRAYEALVEAITARLPSPPTQPQPQTPIASEETLDPRIQGFPRAFLFTRVYPLLPVHRSRAKHMRYTPAHHNPLILFPASEHEPQTVEAGLWICPDERWADTARLVLPYTLSSYPLANGERSLRPRSTELWQHGDCPFYMGHSTRLATMLERWRELVEEGVWTVRADGVEGGVEWYRRAEEEGKEEWFCLGRECFEID